MSAHHNLTAIIKDKRGMVLSVGKNSYLKSHPLMSKLGARLNPNKIYLHAEVDAIIKCNHIEKAYSIEVYRVNNQGIYRPSKPCSICTSAINTTPIKFIKYVDVTCCLITVKKDILINT